MAPHIAISLPVTTISLMCHCRMLTLVITAAACKWVVARPALDASQLRAVGVNVIDQALSSAEQAQATFKSLVFSACVSVMISWKDIVHLLDLSFLDIV